MYIQIPKYLSFQSIRNVLVALLPHTGGKITNYTEEEATAFTEISGTHTLPSDSNNLWLKLTGDCTITAPALPALGTVKPLTINIDPNGFVVSWAASPTISWRTSDQLAPTLVTTAGVISTILLVSARIKSYWFGDFGGNT